MKRARSIALARRRKPDPVPWFVWLALFMAVGIACASAQTAPQTGNKPTGSDTVLRPPNVDPDMTKAPPPSGGFPTPVIRPKTSVPEKPVPLPQTKTKPQQPMSPKPSQPPG